MERELLISTLKQALITLNKGDKELAHIYYQDDSQRTIAQNMGVAISSQKNLEETETLF